MSGFFKAGLRTRVAAIALGLAAGVAITGVAAVGAPSSAFALTLQEALAEAYGGNPTLQARRAALRATDEGVPQAKAGWRPNVELVGDINGLRQRSSTRTTRTESTRLTSGIELQVTQNVFNGGGTEAAVEGAKADVLAARADLVSAEQSILLQTATAYMDVLRDEAVVDLNAQNLNRLQRQLEATRDRYNAGVATLTDVAQAESRIARAKADHLDAQGNLEVARAVFEEVVGLAPTDLGVPVMDLDLPTDREEAKTLAAERNPDVISAVYDRRAALHSIDEQFADLLPSVDLSASASRDLDKASKDSRATDLTLSATVTVPIYQQGFETSQVREAKLTAAQTRLLIEEARRAAIEQASSAWETYRSVVATIQAIREEVRAAEIALDGVQQEELVGQRTVLDVLDAEQELLDASVSLVQAERDETVARFELVAAVGALTAPDLGIAVDAYDPTSHYRATEGLWWGIGEPLEPSADDAAAQQVQP